jgi:hypothetical protein
MASDNNLEVVIHKIIHYLLFSTILKQWILTMQPLDWQEINLK